MTDVPEDLTKDKDELWEYLQETPAQEYVNGVGLSKRDGSYVIYVMLRKRDGELHVPFEWHGWPVVTEVVGEIRAL